MKLLIRLISVSVISSAAALAAIPVNINFDLDPAGSPILAPAVFDDTSPLTELYAPLGVHFSGPATNSGGAILSGEAGFGLDPLSGANVLAFNRTTYAIDPETIIFDTLMSTVSVYAAVSHFQSPYTFVMRAFGSNDVLLATDTKTVFDWTLLSVSSPIGIHRVVLSVDSPSIAAVVIFDNLSAVSVSPQSLPPIISCPDRLTAECGTAAELNATVSDPAGEPLTAVWTVNGLEVQTNYVSAGLPLATTNLSLLIDLSYGTNLVSLNVTNASLNSASCQTIVTVVDTQPPVIVSASVSPRRLWPPNGRLVPVHIKVQTEDSCSAVEWEIIEVRSSEEISGPGAGRRSPDWVITGSHTVSLRAERSGGGGRRYNIIIRARDAANNSSETKVLTVTVANTSLPNGSRRVR